MLAAQARGKGYATEAGLAAKTCAQDTLKLSSLVSYVSAKNVASQNVARKRGAARDAAAEAELGLTDTHVWRHWGKRSARHD